MLLPVRIGGGCVDDGGGYVAGPGAPPTNVTVAPAMGVAPVSTMPQNLADVTARH
jgi:hypothetical protein